MGFRFRKRIKLAPGVHLNIGKKGLSSVSLGGNGLTVNTGSGKTTTTMGIPGTGLSYSTSAGPAAGSQAGSFANRAVTWLWIPIIAFVAYLIFA